MDIYFGPEQLRGVLCVFEQIGSPFRTTSQGGRENWLDAGSPLLLEDSPLGNLCGYCAPTCVRLPQFEEDLVEQFCVFYWLHFSAVSRPSASPPPPSRHTHTHTRLHTHAYSLPQISSSPWWPKPLDTEDTQIVTGSPTLLPVPQTHIPLASEL